MTRQPLPTASSDRYRDRGFIETAGERFRSAPLGSHVRACAKRAYYAALMLRTGGRGLMCTLPDGERIRALPEHRYLSWNPQEYAAFKRAISPGSVALDVGANVGAYAMLLGQWTGPTGRVFAFEPAPQAFNGLVRHLHLNDLAGVVQPIAAAVGDLETRAKFLITGTAGEGRLSVRPDGDDACLSVPVVTIDGFCAREGIDPDFIKIDVEGWELAVLRGARETIRRRGDGLALFVEMHPSLWPHLGTSRECLLDELQAQQLQPVSLGGTDDLWAVEGMAVQLDQVSWVLLMRILLANDGFSDAGGVQAYLDAVIGGLTARGHDLAVLYADASRSPRADAPTGGLPTFGLGEADLQATLKRVVGWGPDLCFSHNMRTLDIDRELIARWPVVKFMHGYFGTCIGGQKRHGFPVAQPCDRRFGLGCLALYGPRHCGELRLGTLVRHYRWAREQHELLARYRTLMVASEHMKGEFVRNGVQPSRIHVNPLFPTHTEEPCPALAGDACGEACVAFVGRMTVLKGGDLLVDAMAQASHRLGQSIRLLMIGDGPQRAAWERRASRRGVPYTATGWLTGDERWTALRQATLLALPSNWPEPFGLVGLEAASLGIPAVAFDVGGVREWLRPGVNGYLAQADPPRASTFAGALVEALGHRESLKAAGRRAVGVAREMSLGRHLDSLDEIFTASVNSTRAARAHAHPAGR